MIFSPPIRPLVVFGANLKEELNILKPEVYDKYKNIDTRTAEKYKVAFILRVKPDKIRYANERPDYWELNAGNGYFSELTSYRF